MSGKPVFTREQILAAYNPALGLVRSAEQFGCAVTTMKRYLTAAGIDTSKRHVEAIDTPPAVSLPEFPDDDISAEEILDTLAKRYERRAQYETARTWFRVKVRENKPIAVAWVGDPHLGSNGCNIPLVRRDAKLLATTPGFHAVNLGDTADNWGKKLLGEYANNDVSRQTERKLARWFLQETGIPWWLWLLGNHDEMDDAFGVYLKTIGGSAMPVMDWGAKFIIEFPNGAEFRVNAAHNHKGSSMWNPLQGQGKAAAMDEQADIFVAGHHHTWAVMQYELPKGVVTLLRSRGYKFIDEHAKKHQFFSEENGATVTTVLDPNQTNQARRVRPIPDIEEAVEYLSWLRGRK